MITRHVYIISEKRHECSNGCLKTISKRLKKENLTNENYQFITGAMLNDSLIFSAILETHSDAIIVLHTSTKTYIFSPNIIPTLIGILEAEPDIDTYEIMCSKLQL